MARCRIGPKKLKNKIQPLMPPGWTVSSAFVRGGREHGLAQVYGISPEGDRLMGWLNYLKGVPFSTKDPWSEEDAPPTRWLPRPAPTDQSS